MPFINLTLFDGQVASGVAAQIATGQDTARRHSITFCNTGTNDETLILTLSRNGGTPRRIRQVILSTNEQMQFNGLPLNKTDVLSAVTTNPNVMDYVVSIAADEAPMGMAVYDASGQAKVVPYLLDQLDAFFS